ncbi:MAG: CPBP family intramembrane metalloprotease [Candidatus Aegiribacteria sp.]|nr:CPBP family intramembrane metalloprotease [Candidatus Aegiribacteria sp.]
MRRRSADPTEKTNENGLLPVLILLLLPAIAVFTGLIVLNSIFATYILFYGMVCISVPLLDQVVFHSQTMSEFFRYIGFVNIRKSLLPGLIIGATFLIAIYLFFMVFSRQLIDTSSMTETLNRWDLDSGNLFVFLFMMIVGNSILEEIYWRGYVFAGLRKLTGPRNTVVLTALFYTSYHLITTITLFSVADGLLLSASIFLVGAFWACLRIKYESIIPAVISHLLADLGLMLIYLKYLAV